MKRSGVASKGIVSACVAALVIISALVAYSIYSPRIGNESSATSKSTSSASSSSTSSATQSTSTSSSASLSNTTSSTSTNSSPDISQVGLEISGWNLVMDNGCCSALGYYGSTSAITWYGNVVRNVPGFGGGTWTGTSQINAFFDESLGTLDASPSLATILDLAVRQVQGGDINATFHLVLNGTSTVYGAVNATVDVEQHWAPVGGDDSGWYLQDDSWNFLSSYVQYSQVTSQVSLQISDWAKSIDGVCCNTVGYYRNSSEVIWYGNTTGAHGTIFFDHTWAGLDTPNSVGGERLGTTLAWLDPSPALMTISNLTLTDVGGGNVNATFHLVVNGTSFQSGAANATANVQMQWTLEPGGSWYIHYESWEFLAAYVQYPGTIITHPRSTG